MDIEKSAKTIEKYLGLSEDAALFAAMCALGGFTIDAWFFPAGMPPGTVTALSGGGGYVFYRWMRKRRVFQDWTLNRVDDLVKKGHLTEENGEKIKKKFIDSWQRDELGKSHDSDEDESN